MENVCHHDAINRNAKYIRQNRANSRGDDFYRIMTRNRIIKNSIMGKQGKDVFSVFPKTKLKETASYPEISIFNIYVTN